MKIKSVIEKDGGVFEFTAELTNEQHQFLIDYALRSLLLAGLIQMPEGETKEEIPPESVN